MVVVVLLLLAAAAAAVVVVVVVVVVTYHGAVGLTITLDVNGPERVCLSVCVLVVFVGPGTRHWWSVIMYKVTLLS